MASYGDVYPVMGLTSTLGRFRRTICDTNTNDGDIAQRESPMSSDDALVFSLAMQDLIMAATFFPRVAQDIHGAVGWVALAGAPLPGHECPHARARPSLREEISGVG